MRRLKLIVRCACVSAVLLAAAIVRAQVDQRGPRRPDAQSYVVVDGTLRFAFAADTLERTGLGFVPVGDLDRPSDYVGIARASSVTFQVDAASDLEILTDRGRFDRIRSGRVSTCGALLLDRPGDRVVVGNLAIEADGAGVLTVSSSLGPSDGPQPIFDLTSVMIQFDAQRRELQLVAELGISESWANLLGLPEFKGLVIGVLTAETQLAPAGPAPAEPGGCVTGGPAGETTGGTASTGPDVLVADLQSTQRWDRMGDITPFAVGTTACNIGTQRASWISGTNQHPVIIQNAYRLDDRGFQQIGMSWVKHGFYAVSQSVCSPCNDPTNGTQLGVGCSDPYTASLNGVQTNMSPRSTVNGHTGEFPYPWPGPAPGSGDSIARRLQIHDADLNPSLNPNARYFIEGHYVTADDAAAGNQDNNASYREIHVNAPSASTYYLTIDASLTTRRGRPAVRAWKDVDSTVAETDIRVPGEGLFILAADARSTGAGTWRYRYALQNLNSDRSARSFAVNFPIGGTVQHATFHDVEYHSGEPYDGTDWQPTFDGVRLIWSTDSYATNPAANALRFDTVYSFSFESNVEPGAGKITVELFKPGQPTEVVASTLGPKLELIDCNQNGIPDLCDVDCAGTGCTPPCGASLDCDHNGVPDECEADCNHNGIPDACDIADCPPGELWCADCNANTVPDGCEPDCNGNGIPDDCDPPGDCDGDGITDCFDLCPCTTPPGACLCPPLGRCCWSSGICIDGYPRASCIATGGTPECLEAPCRQGCLLGDSNNDGVLDFEDVASFQRCFGVDVSSPGYVPPSQECAFHFDFNLDNDVDLEDFAKFRELFTGP